MLFQILHPILPLRLYLENEIVFSLQNQIWTKKALGKYDALIGSNYFIPVSRLLHKIENE